MPSSELQLQYQNFKNALQQLAQKIGDVEQEAEEHKYVQSVLSCLSHDAHDAHDAFIVHYHSNLAQFFFFPPPSSHRSLLKSKFSPCLQTVFPTPLFALI